MNIEELRQYCLSLPESSEKLPFERFFRGRHSILAFYTAGYIFCFIDIDNPDICTVRCPAARRDELAERYEGIVSPYNMDPRSWIGIRLESDLDDTQIRSLIRQSHDVVRGGGRKNTGKNRCGV